MSCSPPSRANRRYQARIIAVSLLYAVTLIGASYGFKHHLVSGPAAYVVAVLPALSIIGMFIAIGRYLVEEQDEYLRMLMVRQSLWASGFALSAATIWGFLENYRLVDHFDVYWVSVLWFFGLGIGAIANGISLHRRGE
jgi:hypothetical protein